MAEQEQVPQAAAKALAESMRMNGRGYGRYVGDPLACATIDLRAAYPVIREQLLREVREALMEDEAIEAAQAIITSFTLPTEDNAGPTSFEIARDVLHAALLETERLSTLTLQPQQVDEEACERCGGDGSFDYPWDAGCKGKHEVAAQVDEEACERCTGSGKQTHVGTVGHPVTVDCSSCHGTGKKPAQVDEAESSEGEKCAECGRTGCPWHIPDVDALARAACEIPAFDDIGVRDWSELLLAMPEWELRPTTGKAPEASTEQKEER